MNQVRTLRHDIPPPPSRIRALSISPKGYPIPYFVAWVNGQADFRIIDPDKLRTCVKQKRCWVCGGMLGKYFAFNCGPMGVINGASSEPPSHRECAEYAAVVCPFLRLPKAQRRNADLPDELKAPGGDMVLHNPEANIVWVTDGYQTFTENGGLLFRMMPAIECLWYYSGRVATRAEAEHGLEKSAAVLRDVAKDDEKMTAKLEGLLIIARNHLPKE